MKMKPIMDVIKENAFDENGEKRDMGDMVLVLSLYYKNKPTVDGATVLERLLEAYCNGIIEW